MTPQRWSWIGACSTGSSHISTGTSCQDAAACIEFSTIDGSALLAIVSDGAGSAEFGAVGSRLVVQCFSRNLREYWRQGQSADDLTEEVVRDWLDDIRDHITAAAQHRCATPRSFAATLVAAIVLMDRVVVCHVGDGACVVRKSDDDQWEVPSWPAHGEYASSTYFVTDDPQPQLRYVSKAGQYTKVAVFSDGLERLVLDFSNTVAFAPFFEPMFSALSDSKPRRARRLSAQLRQFLDSEHVIERTDDDKSLIVARKIVP